MKKYRSQIHCDKCNKEYTTIKHKKKKPIKCKECGSTMIRTLNSWEVN